MSFSRDYIWPNLILFQMRKLRKILIGCVITSLNQYDPSLILLLLSSIPWAFSAESWFLIMILQQPKTNLCLQWQVSTSRMSSTPVISCYLPKDGLVAISFYNWVLQLHLTDGSNLFAPLLLYVANLSTPPSTLWVSFRQYIRTV